MLENNRLIGLPDKAIYFGDKSIFLPKVQGQATDIIGINKPWFACIMQHAYNATEYVRN